MRPHSSSNDNGDGDLVFFCFLGRTWPKLLNGDNLCLDWEADLDGFFNEFEPNDGMKRKAGSAMEQANRNRGAKGGSGILDGLRADGTGVDNASAGQKPYIPLDFDCINSSITI
jgi:hypothetical protein